jgi:hypothetical protein
LSGFLVVAVPLLVAAGIVARWTELYYSLGLDGQYAADYPLGGLLMTGAGVFLVPLIYWLIAFPSLMATGLQIKLPFSGRTQAVYLSAIAAAILILTPGWPAIWIEIIPTALVFLMFWRMRRGGHTSIAPLIETFFLAGLLTAAFAGLTGDAPGMNAVQVTVARGAPIHSGQYILIGQDDQTIALASCSLNPRGTVVTLSRGYVVAVVVDSDVLPSSHNSSLWSVITRSGSPQLFQKPC